MQNFEDQAIYPSAELYLIDQFMRRHDFKPAQWLLGTGLREQDITHPELLVSLKQFDIIYRNIYRLSPEPDIGLQLGLALNLSRWGMVALAMMTERTVGYALEVAREFQTLVRGRFRLIPKRHGQNIRISLDKLETMRFPVSEQFSYEILIGTTQRQIEDLRSRSFHFDRIELSYSSPPHGARYRDYFGCDVSFGCAASALWLPKDVLEQPMPLTNAIACAQARRLCSDEVMRIQNTLNRDIQWQVKQALTSHTPPPDLEQVARLLNLSARSLRRHLQAARCSFRDLHNEHSMQLALHLLSDSHTTLQEIAESCGFSQLTSFREAFKRWTGITPTRYRKQLSKQCRN